MQQIILAKIITVLLHTRCFAAILFWLFSKCHVIKISKIFGDFVPRDPAFADDPPF